MNIICSICSDLLEPSSDIYNTPCGHIFHFQCLTKWIERSHTCPQCREKTTAKSIHRIYFNIPNDYSSHLQSPDQYLTDNTKLQSEIHSVNFQLTLAKKNIKDLTEAKTQLQLNLDSCQELIKHFELIITSKDNTIYTLKEQIKCCKLLCTDVKKKDKEIETLNIKLEKLQSVQNILDASANEVDRMINSSYADISKLQTFVSVLKRELENNISQKKQLRERAFATSRVVAELSRARNKLMQLEKTLEDQEKEKVILQTKLLEMQTTVHECKCKKITAIEGNYLNKSSNSMEVPVTIETKNTSNSCTNKILGIEEDNDCIVIEDNAENTENTPQNIKSKGFFSTANHGIKRAGNSITVPLILTKKRLHSMNLNKSDQLGKKTANSGMTFDGFGGHTKYDQFPASIQSSHTKKLEAKLICKNQKN